MTTQNGSEDNAKNENIGRVATERSDKKRPPRKQPERVWIKTRLYSKKDSELLVQIYELQDDPEKVFTYTQTFRDAFELIFSLRRREISVLFRLFPWLMDGHMNTTQLNYLQSLQDRLQESHERVRELEQEVKTLKENQQTRV
jgi:hypothetical protein